MSCRPKILTLAMVFRDVKTHRTKVSTSSSSSSSSAVAVAGGRQVLLGWKKRGWGPHTWNGFGGKVEPTDKSVAHAAARELQEEAYIRVKVQDLTRRALMTFSFDGQRDKRLEVHVFATDRFDGIPRESDEMVPKWFDVDAIPFDQMWGPNDRLWLPSVLQDKCVQGHVHYAADETTILHHTLREVNANGEKRNLEPL